MRRTPRQQRFVMGVWVAVVFCAGLAASCGGKSSSSRWQIVASELPEAVLAIAGRSDRDIWAVGADQGSGPLALHYDGTAWTRVATGSRGTLWWTQSFADGTTMMAGAQSTILVTTDGVTFTRQHTPGLANATVFGLWGAASNDVYAVGGIAGRDGFIWHFDGSTWSEVDLGSVLPPNGLPATDLGDWPGFFKVWGDPVGRVYVVGGRGVLLRRDRRRPVRRSSRPMRPTRRCSPCTARCSARSRSAAAPAAGSSRPAPPAASRTSPRRARR